VVSFLWGVSPPDFISLNHLSMRVQLPAVVLSFAAFAYAQITDGLSFDGGDVVSLLWGLDSETPSTYDFYLCAGDETTDSYVCCSFEVRVLYFVLITI
jgi:trehalose-6-phosphatase